MDACRDEPVAVGAESGSVSRARVRNRRDHFASAGVPDFRAAAFDRGGYKAVAVRTERSDGRRAAMRQFCEWPARCHVPELDHRCRVRRGRMDEPASVAAQLEQVLPPREVVDGRQCWLSSGRVPEANLRIGKLLRVEPGRGQPPPVTGEGRRVGLVVVREGVQDLPRGGVQDADVRSAVTHRDLAAGRVISGPGNVPQVTPRPGHLATCRRVHELDSRRAIVG